MFRNASDFGHIVPATLALLRLRRADFDRGLVAFGLHEFDRAHDHHEAKFVAERREKLVVFGRRADRADRLQGRTHRALRAFLFDRDLRVGADGADAFPLREKRVAVLGFGQAFEGIEEDRGVVVLHEDGPAFFGREGEDRRDQTEEVLRDVPEGRLRRAAGVTRRARRVETVLEDVEVEAPEVGRGVGLQERHDVVEAVFLVLGHDGVLELLRKGHRPAVEFEHFVDRHEIGFREVRRVRQEKAQGVAHAAVVFDHVLHDRFAVAKFARIVGRGDPEAQDVGAVLFDHFLRTDDVALRLRHLFTLFVDDEAVGEQLLVGRNAVEHRADEKRRVEPAAVLVGAFEVEVGREPEDVGVAAAHHRVVGRTRVEPHVENVGRLHVVGRFGAEEVFGRGLGPGFDAALFDEFGDAVHDLERLRMEFARGLVHEEGKRHAPVALTRNAPVRTVFDHRVEAVDAPLREELRRLDARERRVAQSALFGGKTENALRVGVGRVHADEPLRGRAVDERRLVAPAVHVAVRELAVRKEVPRDGEGVHDGFGRLPDVEAAKERKPVGKDAVALHGADDVVVLEAVALAGDEVVHAVGRGAVNDAGTRRRVDVVGEVDGRAAAIAFVHVVERVEEFKRVQRFALDGGEHGAREFVALERLFVKTFTEDEKLRAGVDEDVVEFGIDVQGLVRRNRPGGRRPDHREAGLFELHAEDRFDAFLLVFSEFEGDVDRRARLVLVFHFGFGERGLAVKAPVHGLEAAVDVALFHDALQGTDFVGFRVVAHRAVRIVPIAENAQALEVGALLLDLFGRVGARKALRLVDGKVLAVELFDLHFDRHAVAVPARNVGGEEAFERLFLEDDVLQDLVDGVAEVNRAVRIGRAVVKNELLRVAARIDDAVVNLSFFPAANPGGFALGEVPTHREGRIRQIERILLVGGFVLRHHVSPDPLGLFS